MLLKSLGKCWQIKIMKAISSGCYFIIRLAQTKITLFIFVNNWVMRGKESFLLVELCSHVTCCVEIKLTIFLSQIYLYLYNLYATNVTYFGNSLWHVLSSLWQQLLGKIYASGNKMEQRSVTLLPTGKPRAVDNTASMFWDWPFRSSVCVCWAVIGNDATKIYKM